MLLSLQVPYLGSLRAASAAEESLEAFPGIDAKWQGAARARAPTATRDGSPGSPGCQITPVMSEESSSWNGTIFFPRKESNRGREDRHALAGTLAFLSLGQPQASLLLSIGTG